jgi:hypothetical protein
MILVIKFRYYVDFYNTRYNVEIKFSKIKLSGIQNSSGTM